MKALSTELSSPMRADTFRPPLMMFSKRSNGSRKRATPIFHLRKHSNIEISQEPSSPKVTCIGQIKSGGGAAVTRRRFVFPSSFYNQRRGFRRLFRMLFRSDYCRKIDAVEDCFRVQSEKIADERENRIQEIGIENGMILKRCRSAPYRSSSLGGRFLAENDEKTEDLQNSVSESEENSRIVQECGEKFDDSVNNDEDLKGIVGFSVHPLMLTRCKSEPARGEERLLRRFG